jgi:pimeloyl-ACP methyl ester carboxylesterase
MRGEFVDIGGTRLYYYAAGTRGGGDPIVFLHGFPGSAHSWRLLVPLMPEGRRLVLADLAGCGRSDAPASDCRTVDGHARLVRGLMDDLRIARAALVGHAVGAAVALEVARLDAVRVSALVALAPVACGAWPRGMGRLARAAAPLARFVGPAALASFLHGSALRGYADRERGRRSLDRALRTYRSRLTAASFTAHLALPRSAAAAVRPPEPGAVQLPTAVVIGSADPFMPRASAERLQAMIPGATLHVIEGARHFVAEDAPEQCARVIGEVLGRA